MVEQLTLQERWSRFVKDWTKEFKHEHATSKGLMVFGGIATSFSYDIRHEYNDEYIDQVLLVHVTDDLSKDFIKRVYERLEEHRIPYTECRLEHPVVITRYCYMHSMYIMSLLDYLNRTVTHAIQLNPGLKSFVDYLVKRIEMQ